MPITLLDMCISLPSSLTRASFSSLSRLWINAEISRDENAHDRRETAYRVIMQCIRIIRRGMPHGRKRRGDQMQHGHTFNYANRNQRGVEDLPRCMNGTWSSSTALYVNPAWKICGNCPMQFNRFTSASRNAYACGMRELQITNRSPAIGRRADSRRVRPHC